MQKHNHGKLLLKELDVLDGVSWGKVRQEDRKGVRQKRPKS